VVRGATRGVTNQYVWAGVVADESGVVMVLDRVADAVSSAVDSIIDFAAWGRRLAGPIVSVLENATESLIEGFLEFFFSILPLRTEGPFPFGRPIGPELVEWGNVATRGAFAGMAADIYDHAVASQGGEIIVSTFIMLLIFIPVRILSANLATARLVRNVTGYTDLAWRYSGSQRSTVLLG